MLTLPAPDARSTVIHDTRLAAVHGQASCVVRVMAPDPPSCGYDAMSGSMLYVQVGSGGLACCRTGIVLPAIVSVAVRSALAGLAATLNGIDAALLPLADPVNAIQFTSD